MSSKPLILFGAGNNSICALEQFRKQGCEPVCFIDNDVHKQSGACYGLPVISLENALERFGTLGFEVFVTPNPPVQYEIMKDLVSAGVPKESILNYVPSHHGRSCASLLNCLLIFNKEFHYCCALGNLRNPPPRLYLPDNISDAVDGFLSYRDKLLQDMEDGKPTVCDGCAEIKETMYIGEPKIRSISFSPSFPCNLLCSYCDVWKTARSVPEDIREWHKSFSFRNLLAELERRGQIDENCPIEISGGEIAISPRCDEILDAVWKYPVLLFSNCVVYNEKVAKLIAKPDSFLLESLDAGTRETFTKIKGKDCFETVVANIKKYARSGGNIQLKYIVTLENSNDNDYYGFLDICDAIRPQKIRLSADINNDYSKFPKQIVDFAISLGREAIKRGHPVLVLEHFGKENDERIKLEIFARGND